MEELKDLINRLSDMTYNDRDDKPDTAILILTQNEIGKILEALRKEQKVLAENLA